MKTEINKLSAAARKRVTRQIIEQLRMLRCWYSDASAEANAAEYDGDKDAASMWDEQARLYREEYAQLERSIA